MILNLTCYKESYLCLITDILNYLYFAVNFCFSELDKVSGSTREWICYTCTLDIVCIWIVLIYKRMDLLYFGHYPYLEAASIHVLTP